MKLKFQSDVITPVQGHEWLESYPACTDSKEKPGWLTVYDKVILGYRTHTVWTDIHLSHTYSDLLTLECMLPSQSSFVPFCSCLLTSNAVGGYSEQTQPAAHFSKLGTHMSTFMGRSCDLTPLKCASATDMGLKTLNLLQSYLQCKLADN